MLCLGIETSCDETSLALVRDGVLTGHTLASQAPAHAVFGGVVPELASREHYRFIGPLFDELLERSGTSPEMIDVIAVARGPGLLGSLLVGNAFAKGLALGLNRPILGVNHLVAHLLAAGLAQPLEFPGLGLLISGGHTRLYRLNSPADMLLLGRSLDDAAGEVFDKVGVELGFSYPAGKMIDACARIGKADKFTLPRPYLDNDNLDFSFSGLKTAAVNTLRAVRQADPDFRQKIGDFCRSLEEAIADTLYEKTRRALRENSDITSIWLAGGVAANSLIRGKIETLAVENGKKFLAPKLEYCVDNAAMIAYAGWLLADSGYSHKLGFTIIPRGRKIPFDFVKMPS